MKFRQLWHADFMRAYAYIEGNKLKKTYFSRGLIMVMWGIELYRETEIGAGFYVTHFGGIIVSPLAKLGSNVTLSQGVTIGVSGQGEKMRKEVCRLLVTMYTLLLEQSCLGK
jgi:serine acetyltransferase